MGQVQQRVLIALLACGSLLDARKFYDDDPLLREPAPIPVQKLVERKLSDIYDLFSHMFGEVGDKRKIRALDINTLGEVPDGAWYENRKLTVEQVAAGPGNTGAPADGPWTIVSAKSEGVTPGFRVEDSKGRRYLLKFDPLRHVELATAADVISSKLFYALGYHVPENYVVVFDRSRLKLGKNTKFTDERGRKRALTARDIGEILTKVPRDASGRLRATASRFLPGAPLGPYRYFGTRTDDPNDTIPHEHRRSLRGLHVICAWLAHEDSRAINSLDVLVDGYVKHHLIDFGSTIGSASTKVNSPRSNFEQFFTWKSTAKEFFSLGMFIPKWSTIRYPDLPSVGRISAQYFDPETWTPEYPNPAFRNRTPEDTFWAAERVMSLSDEAIRAAVRTGMYSDPKAEKYVIETLIKRRDAVGRAYLSKPASLSGIRVENGQVVFEDLAVRYRFVSPAPAYGYRWFVFDNEKETKTPLAGDTSSIPRTEARYLGVEISAAGRTVTVYLRQGAAGPSVVGIERAY